MDIITAALAASMSGGGGGGTGTDDYNELSNKPKINGVTLAGNKSLSDIGAAAADETYTDEEVDALLAEKADADDVYTKAEADTELAKKVDKETGKGLSTNDFTNADKANLATALEKANAAAPQSTTYTKPEVDTALAAKLNAADVDDALSSTSTNPVQNKVVYTDQQRQDAEIGLLNRYGGGKNLITVNSWTGSGENVVVVEYNCHLPAGRYVFTYDATDFSGTYSLSGYDATGKYVHGSLQGNITSHKEATAIWESDIYNLKLFISGQATLSNIMLCAESDWTASHAFQPYAKSNYELTQAVEPIPRLVDAGAKNLLKVTATSQTISGVTFTVNDDGTVTANGTSTATISFVLNSSTGLESDSYVLSGCPSGGSWDSYYLTVRSNGAWLAVPDFGNSAPINGTVTQVAISIQSGQTVNNLTFKPMLCTAEDYAISPEFVPYAPSNRELYEMILALQNAQNGG